MPSVIEPAQRIVLDRRDGNRAYVDLSQVTQRNWSRTAAATDGTRPLFVKQFVGLDGKVRPELRDDELRGLEVARRCFDGRLRLPSIVGASETQVLLCYEDLQLLPVDVALRDDPRSIDMAWSKLGDVLAEVVERVAEPELVARCSDLTTKNRPYHARQLAVNFKGLEMRNLATRSWEGFASNRERLAAFDFGRPYLAPIEEVAARLLVSTLLLNWGHPLSRFRLGPPIELADQLADRLEPHLVPEAVQLELARETRARRVVSRFGSRQLRALKTLGLTTLGAMYLRRARRWCGDRGLG